MAAGSATSLVVFEHLLENSHNAAGAERRRDMFWGLSWKDHESQTQREEWCGITAQVHTIDQTVHPPNKHSFVSQRLLVGRWPPVTLFRKAPNS